MIFNDPRAVEIDGSFFSFKIKTSQNNKEYLTINEKLIHSKFNPEKETQEIKYQGINIIAVFGLGLGYNLKNIILNNPDSIIILYEPFLELINNFKNSNDLKSNVLIIEKIDLNTIYSFLVENNYFLEGRIYTYSNQGYKNLFPKLETDFFLSVKKSYEIIVQNIMTESNFINLWSKNFIDNLTNLDSKPLLNIQKKELNENLAVIVCAGPTLESDLKLLKIFREKITLFAVDTAIKPLLKNNIIPDFIVSLDSQYYSYEDFIKNNNSEIAYLLDVLSYPRINEFSKNIFYTLTSNFFQKTLVEYFFKYNKLKEFGYQTGGTVSDYTLNICADFGFKNIYFTGLDLSYPQLLTHSKETPFYERALRNSTYFNSIETFMVKVINNRNVKQVKSKNDSLIFTDLILENYKNYFEVFSKNNQNMNIFYNELDGIFINGFTKINLEKLISNLKTSRLTKKDLIDQKDCIYIEKTKVQNFSEDTITILYEYSLKIKELFENTNFDLNDEKQVENFLTFYNDMNQKLPFMKKFSIMTEIILNKKNIDSTKLIYYKHLSFNILQSIYFLIRTFQKSLKIG